MKLKSALRRAALLALCAALMLPAAGAVGGSVSSASPVSDRFWGTISHLKNDRLLLTNDTGAEGTMDQLILRVGENTLILDAATGDPIALDSIEDGETVYVNTDTIMLLSYPAQTGAQLILANLPADMAAPDYYQVTGFSMISTMMTENNVITATISTDLGDTLTFHLTDKLDESGARQYILQDEVEISAYRTRNIVTVPDLIPGTRILVWKDAAGTPSRILVFPYTYRGYLEVQDKFAVIDGDMVIEGSRMGEDGEPLLPLRHVCESLGMTVRWNQADRSITVSRDGAEVFSCTLGEEEAQKGGETVWLTAPTAENGTTYLHARDLAELLGYYFVG